MIYFYFPTGFYGRLDIFHRGREYIGKRARFGPLRNCTGDAQMKYSEIESEDGIEPAAENPSPDFTDIYQEDEAIEAPVITDIYWERVFLHFTVMDVSGKTIFLRRSGQTRLNAIHLKPEYEEGGYAHYLVNITAVKDRSFLENGSWEIGLFSERGAFFPCSVWEGFAPALDYLDRIFPYGGSDAYTVNFIPYTKDDVEIRFRLVSRFMKENKRWKKRGLLHESYITKKHFKKAVYLITRRCINIFYRILVLFMPKRGRNILLISDTMDCFTEGGETGNLGALLRRIRERNIHMEFRVKCSAFKAPAGRKSSYMWFKNVLLIARSDIIFVDNYAPVFNSINMDKRTKLIQVWHSGLGFKAVGYCRFGKPGSPYPLESCHRKYTWALCGSPDLVHVYAEVFGIEPEVILPIGIPRMDGAGDPRRERAIRETFFGEYPELEGKRILLFAPTFRGTGQKDAFYNYSMLDYERLWDFCGEDSVFIMKMHPYTKKRPQVEEYSPRILDFSDYRDVNDLLHVADVLITDYSSIYYDYAILGKPIVFYTYDRILYEVTRGVHQDILSSAPGKVCDTFDGLIEALEVEDYEIEKTEAFRERHFGGTGQNASDFLIDRIILRDRL